MDHYEVPSSFPTQVLETMYTQIRDLAINNWAKLPEQSFIRILFGNLIFILMPPPDRTVPWSLLEEIASFLLLAAAAGADALIQGWIPIRLYPNFVLVWFYLAVTAPGYIAPVMPDFSMVPPVQPLLQGANGPILWIDQNGRVSRVAPPKGQSHP